MTAATFVVCVSLFWWILFAYIVGHLALSEKASNSTPENEASHLARTRVRPGRRWDTD